MRTHPHLYEINTWPWLERLSRQHGRPVTLGAIPDREWDRIRARGIDFVYLMGVWRRSPLGREIARSDPNCFQAYDRALPGWREDDVAGSAYCITGYEPDPHLGTAAGLAALRSQLHGRGMRLIVDFIPNHVAFDHPWIVEHPERFVAGSEDAFQRDPAAFRAVELPSHDVRFIACARDPYFPPWSDVAQLDYTNDETRAAVLRELEGIAEHADGVRCDMAMLLLSDVFAGTWQSLTGRAPAGGEFWSEARRAVPGCLLLGEVYWDLEWRLQQLGFDFTYDKRLYDSLLHGSAEGVRGHLRADPPYQRRSARFIENHDEARSAEAFGGRAGVAAVAMSTLQGMRFYHEGQFEGRRIRLPVQLAVEPDEPIDRDLSTFYDRLLPIVNQEVFHDGEWTLCDVQSIDDTSASLAAWSWTRGSDRRLVVVNLGGVDAQGHVDVARMLPPQGDRFVFEDLLDGIRYERERRRLIDGGLYVRLRFGQAHVFEIGAEDAPVSASSNREAR